MRVFFRVPLVLVLTMLASACDGTSPPTAPLASASPSPAPAPENPAPPAAPLLNVPERNTIFLPAPAPPPASADPIAGRYALDIAFTSSGSGFRCETVPEHAKRRTYTADVTSRGDHHAVLLYDARFIRDFGGLNMLCTDRRLDTRGVCHQFVLYGDASALSTSIMAEDEGNGSVIWEVLPEGRLLAINGIAYGSIENGKIQTSGAGSVWYGNGLPASEYGACQGNVSLTFTRR